MHSEKQKRQDSDLELRNRWFRCKAELNSDPLLYICAVTTNVTVPVAPMKLGLATRKLLPF